MVRVALVSGVKKPRPADTSVLRIVQATYEADELSRLSVTHVEFCNNRIDAVRHCVKDKLSEENR